MISRCYVPTSASYSNYGKRGVVVCEEWLNSFYEFYEWSLSNGWAKGMAIDKEVKAKLLEVEPLLYSPERCCFVTRAVNNRNKRSNVFYEYAGEKLILNDWVTKLGISRGALVERLRVKKWSIEKSFSTPLMKTNGEIMVCSLSLTNLKTSLNNK